MRIVLFCENKYAVDILHPIGLEADREGGNEVLWYVHKEKIPVFPLKEQVAWTNNMQEVYDFHRKLFLFRETSFHIIYRV